LEKFNTTWQNKISKVVNRGQGETTWQEKINAVKYNSEKSLFENFDRKI